MYVVMSLVILFCAVHFMHGYQNPFACKRPALLPRVQSNPIDNFEFIGLVGNSFLKKAVVRSHGELVIIGEGQAVSGVLITQINSGSIRVAYKKKEYILTVKGE